LDFVYRLGRRASRTVGFLPAGAYVDYFWRRGVLVAIDGDILGYVMFATSRERVRVAQLVVARDAQRQGIARLLMESLVRDRWHYYGMMLRCRADFPAATLWPRLGFAAISSRRGRAGEVVQWWRRLGGAGVFAMDTARRST
jgi:GNAT superfamily N-acetyltransferase